MILSIFAYAHGDDTVRRGWHVELAAVRVCEPAICDIESLGILTLLE
jgi:hypothetical protein